MASDKPVLGIDFGTSNSKMAWYNPKTRQAEVLLNAEGEQQTPSVVYFGTQEILVGKDALEKLEYPEEWERVIISAKREMVNDAPIALPDRIIRATDVAKEILRKLKRDAEDGHFHEEIKHVVVTCPARFDSLEQDKIRQAALSAGFREVELIKEPVAAAYAYAQMGLKVGRYVLVYDLGGGTFDLAVLGREDNESFFPVIPPQGIKRCGGDDFDEALYNFCDKIAEDTLKRSISSTDRRDLYFLFECRRRKHNLTTSERSTFSSLLQPDATRFRYELSRASFEGLIRGKVEETVQQTKKILEDARQQGYEVDTFVLIGGSSRVPLIGTMLKEQLALAPLKFDKQDIAVALGGAYLAYKKWNPEPVPPKPTPRLDRQTTMPGRDVETRAPVSIKAKPAQSVEPPKSVPEIFTLTNTLTGHDGWIRSLAISSDGLILASGSEDTTVKFWNPITGQLFRTLAAHSGQGQGVFSVAFSPNGQLLASGGADQKAKIWNRQGALMLILSGHKGLFADVNAVAINSSIVATGSNDKSIRLWNSGTGMSLSTLNAHTEIVLSVAFSPDGQLLASGSADNTIRLWQIQSQRTLRILGGHADAVRCVVFSPDGQTLVSSSSDQSIKLWDIRTGQLLRTLTGHSGIVCSVAISPDGRTLASGGLDDVIKLWDIKTGQLLGTLTGNSWSIRVVAFSPDGQRLVSGGDDKTIKVWKRNR